jgi:cytoskeletal protein CcmA (bactofilin family)
MFGRSSRKKDIRHDEITAFLGAGTQYNGQFDFQGIVRIDGGVNGDINSDGTLVLGEGGCVQGRIRVGTIISNGRIKGDVEASIRVVLNKNSNLEGNLRAPAMVIEEGAVVNGLISMDFSPLEQIPERTGEPGD